MSDSTSDTETPTLSGAIAAIEKRNGVVKHHTLGPWQFKPGTVSNGILGSGTVSREKGNRPEILDRFSRCDNVLGPPRSRRLSPIERDIRGLFMTLCIAAICRQENVIVVVSDYMLSTTTHSIEAALSKVVPIGKSNRWLQLFSGDPSHALTVLTSVSYRLMQSKTEDTASVIIAYQSAFQQELKEKAEAQLLSPLGMTREEFLQNGRQQLGDEQFSRILFQVQHIGLETDFLVAGFEPADNSPHLFSFSDPGTRYIHDAMSFHAIGCGAPLAEAFLMSIPFDPFSSLSDMIYRLCEAKFKSEAAPGVGKRTHLATLNKDGEWNRYLSEEVQKVRDIWEVNKHQPVPEAVEPVIKQLAPIQLTRPTNSSKLQT